MVASPFLTASVFWDQWMGAEAYFKVARKIGMPYGKDIKDDKEIEMNILLWVLRVLLAVFFGFHGWLYLAWPAKMVEQMRKQNPNGKILGLSDNFRHFIGVAEWVAAVGMVLPGLTGILPWLTPIAATGLMIIMASAVVFHLSAHERKEAIFPALWFVFATVAAYMSFLA
jgi:uncharacterized membrane protein YphA (DoxX/SURF4 family)